MKQRLLAMAAAAALMSTGAALAKEDDAPSKRFTAERVFDMEYATDPQVSPDGKTVVYVRHAMDRMTDRDTGSLWTIDLATGAQRPLVTGAPASSPRWSPDGTRIAFVRVCQGGPRELWIMNRDGSDPQRLTDGYQHKGADHLRWIRIAQDADKIH